MFVGIKTSCKIVDAFHSEKFRLGFVYTISKMTKYQYNDWKQLWAQNSVGFC